MLSLLVDLRYELDLLNMQSCSSDIGISNGYSNTGGSGNGALETLLWKVLQRSTLEERNCGPRIYKRGNDIKEHLRRLDDYVLSVGLDNDGKCAYLINSLEETVQFELFSYLEYADNSRDYKWLWDKLHSLFSGRNSSAGPLMQLLKIKQQEEQPLREFLTDIRVNAVKIMGLNSDSRLREEYMITAFINGLSNKRAAIALKQLNPKTLEECFVLVKKEKSDLIHSDQENNLRVIAGMQPKQNTGVQYNRTLESIENQVRQLQSQISYLLSIIQRKADSPAIMRPSYAQAAGHYPTIRGPTHPKNTLERSPHQGMKHKCVCRHAPHYDVLIVHKWGTWLEIVITRQYVVYVEQWDTTLALAHRMALRECDAYLKRAKSRNLLTHIA